MNLIILDDYVLGRDTCVLAADYNYVLALSLDVVVLAFNVLFCS